MGIALDAMNCRSTVQAQLSKWSQWATRPDLELSEEQHELCEGPTCLAYLSDRADIGGVRFTSARVQERAAGKHCTIAVTFDNFVAVGQVRSFMKWQPPWGRTEHDRIEVADVQWYKPRGRNSRLHRAPQVTWAFSSDIFDPPGNLIRVAEVLPMPVCLLPHLQRPQWWQVLLLSSLYA